MPSNPDLVAERYKHRLYHWNPEHVVMRWWVGPDKMGNGKRILVGGSILDKADWEHLRDDFGITHVVNVETEHSDAEKVPADRLCEVQYEDNGDAISNENVKRILDFAREHRDEATFYVHCQMGGSRSPAVAYAILRECEGWSPEEALAMVNDGFQHRKEPGHPRYGDHPTHQSYLTSFERWFKDPT